MLPFDLLVLLVSLAVLVKSSEWVIKHIIVLTRFFHVSEMTVGFILVSISTTLPELMVSVWSSWIGKAQLSVGNALGSNVANIGLVMGASLLFAPLVLKRKDAHWLSTLLLFVSLSPFLFFLPELSRFVGVLLIAAFLVFVFASFRRGVVLEREPEEPNLWRVMKAFLLFAFGIALVVASSHFVVQTASAIALVLGISQLVIGATIIAVGTSLPELAVGIAAARKGKIELMVGNVLGANILNLTLVLGASAVAKPLVLNLVEMMPLVVSVLLFTFLFWFLIQNKNKHLPVNPALLLIGAYLVFLASQVKPYIFP
ncbi:MAG: sodium:calcium antiporter [Candidatus Micrarchaeota archaeon]